MKTAQKSLSSWSWKSIYDVYSILGRQLKSYKDVRDRCKVPETIDINFSDENNTFIIRFWRDVNRINAQLEALDKEIARRNKLVGII